MLEWYKEILDGFFFKHKAKQVALRKPTVTNILLLFTVTFVMNLMF